MDLSQSELSLLLDDAEQACASAAKLVTDNIVDGRATAWIWALEQWKTNVARAGDAANPTKGSALEERCYKVLCEIEAMTVAIDLARGRRHCQKHPAGCPDILQCTREQFDVADIVIRGGHLDQFTPGGKA